MVIRIVEEYERVVGFPLDWLREMATHYNAQRHEGPWPLDPEQPLECDHCNALIRQMSDPWLAYANPYGPFGWTLLCGACAKLERERAIEYDIRT